MRIQRRREQKNSRWNPTKKREEVWKFRLLDMIFGKRKQTNGVRSEKSRESIHGKNHHRGGIQGQAMKRETVETTVQWKNRSHEGKRNRRLYYWIQAQTLLCPQSFGCHVHLRVLCFLQNWPYLDPYRVFYSLFYSEIIFYHLPCRNAPLLVSKGFS